MHREGFDPREAKVWRRVIERIDPDSSMLDSIWSSHPAAVERLRNLNREIAWNYYATANELPVFDRAQAAQKYRTEVLARLPVVRH